MKGIMTMLGQNEIEKKKKRRCPKKEKTSGEGRDEVNTGGREGGSQ